VLANTEIVGQCSAPSCAMHGRVVGPTPLNSRGCTGPTRPRERVGINTHRAARVSTRSTHAWALVWFATIAFSCTRGHYATGAQRASRPRRHHPKSTCSRNVPALQRELHAAHTRVRWYCAISAHTATGGGLLAQHQRLIRGAWQTSTRQATLLATRQRPTRCYMPCTNTYDGVACQAPPSQAVVA
jgi:hypothetical protein